MATVCIINGYSGTFDRITHSGASVREMKPYDGNLDMHIAQTGLHRQELWANGRLKQAGEWMCE